MTCKIDPKLQKEHAEERTNALKELVRQDVKRIAATYVGQKASKLVVEHMRKRIGAHLTHRRCVLGVAVDYKLRVAKDGIIKNVTPTIKGRPILDPLLPEIVENLTKESGHLKAAINHDGMTIHYAWGDDAWGDDPVFVKQAKVHSVEEIKVGRERERRWQKTCGKFTSKSSAEGQKLLAKMARNSSKTPQKPKNKREIWKRIVVKYYRKVLNSVVNTCRRLWPRKAYKAPRGYLADWPRKRIRQYGRHLKKMAQQFNWARLAGITTEESKKRRWWPFGGFIK
jgi:hypothetical protein